MRGDLEQAGVSEPGGAIGGCPDGLGLLAGGVLLAIQLAGDGIAARGLALLLACLLLGVVLRQGDAVVVMVAFS